MTTQCLSDPLTEAFICKRPDGSEYDIPWKLTDDYVCMPRPDYKILFEESRKK